jgi:MinD-like ATPase involved in chromosome partitioning or flagellar assembly
MSGWLARDVGAVLQLLIVTNKKLDAVNNSLKTLAVGQQTLIDSQQTLIRSQQASEEELDKIKAAVKQILTDLAPAQAVTFEATMSVGE